MHSRIKLLSIDFDGTLVSRVSEPVLDTQCMGLIRAMQDAGAIWAINTGRSVDLLESGLADFSFPIRPDFILTTERDVFRPGRNGAHHRIYRASASRASELGLSTEHGLPAFLPRRLPQRGGAGGAGASSASSARKYLL